MTQMPLPPFLDVPTLLESSRPRTPVPWLRYLVTMFAVFLIVVLIGRHSEQEILLIRFFCISVLVSVLGAAVARNIAMRRQVMTEQKTADAVAELVQLRLWPQAAMSLQQILSQPTSTPQLRTRALVYLAAVLSRYQRFADAIVVHEHLLAQGGVDGPTASALRVGRAIAMLREDHLFDADRAITELRRSEGSGDSAGFALVELYRHVKTGHPQDAIDLFQSKLPILRDQLGHRLSDVYGLLACAYDLRERVTEAAEAWRNATLLAPVAELSRRYPELEKLAGRYAAAQAPPEMA